MPASARLVLNPAAGRGRGARHRAALGRIARRHGVEVEESAGGADLTRLARQAVAAGCERLLAAGGDGTYHHVAQGLAGTPCALVPIALGTGNDLARELGLPLAAESAIAVGLEAPLAAMDLGRSGGRYFCGVAGSGVDSETAERSQRVRRLRGPLVYVWTVLVVLARFRPPRLELEVNGERSAGRVMMVALANTRYFGGGMKIAPDADRADGLFDIVRIGEISRPAFLGIFPRVYRGRHAGHPACTTVRAPSARIRFDREMACWGDGERLSVVDREGLLVEIVPGALRVPQLARASPRRRDRNVSFHRGALP